MKLEWAVQSLAHRSIPIFIVSCHGASWYKAAQLGGWCNLTPGTSNMTQAVALINEFSYPTVP